MFRNILLSIIVLCLIGIGYELQQTRRMAETYLIQQNIVLTNRIDGHMRAINGMSDRLRAEDAYIDELADKIDRINGVTPQQFRRRKNLR